MNLFGFEKKREEPPGGLEDFWSPQRSDDPKESDGNEVDADTIMETAPPQPQLTDEELLEELDISETSKTVDKTESSKEPDESNESDPSPSEDEIRGLSSLYSPQQSSNEQTGSSEAQDDLADILFEIGALTPEAHCRLRQELVVRPQLDVEVFLLESDLIEEKDLLAAKAHSYGLEFKEFDIEQVDRSVLNKSGLEIDFLMDNYLCPVALEWDNLVLATSQPPNVLAVEDVRRRSQMKVSVVVCTQQNIELLWEHIKEQEVDSDFDGIISDMMNVEIVADQDDGSEDLEEMAARSPIIKFVNYLISNAIGEGASDIHIEPKNKCTRIRYRIDGALFEVRQAPLKMHPAIVSRIKIMANLDISERRLPQDGKVSVLAGGRTIDLRISTLPTNRGEKVVIRLLDSRSILRGLEKLGMESKTLELFRQQIEMPNGIMLVTGPTGSGKSTTLYSAISQMDGDKMNISTVEDPVEYELDFCNQVQVKEQIGMDFAAALRSLLRQDPDVIMIGEIRDNETARIAVQAALTGHLVLSTLHTNDAPSSITRLVNIGIDAYLIAASLNAVLAQRLVRRICSHCKESYSIPENMRASIERMGIDPKLLYHGKGCDKCRESGYSGRVGIYEMLIIDERFRDMINKDSSVSNMRRAFRQSKSPALYEDGIEKVKKGLTTVEEVLRVTQVYGKSEDEVFVENIN